MAGNNGRWRLLIFFIYLFVAIIYNEQTNTGGRPPSSCLSSLLSHATRALWRFWRTQHNSRLVTFTWVSITPQVQVYVWRARAPTTKYDWPSKKVQKKCQYLISVICRVEFLIRFPFQITIEHPKRTKIDKVMVYRV